MPSLNASNIKKLLWRADTSAAAAGAGDPRRWIQVGGKVGGVQRDSDDGTASPMMVTDDDEREQRLQDFG